MRITILGHASVLVEAGDERVLVDPLFADSFAQGVIGFRPARTIHRDRMPAPTAIVVTHLHLDHWHPPTLEQFDRSTPIIAPADTFLQRRLGELGFTDVTVAEPWQPIGRGDLILTPTPSRGEIDEFGLVFRHGPAVYWHVSDSVAAEDDGHRVRTEIGRPAVAAARYQPITPLVSFQRALGVSHDERDGMVEWLEAACASEPSFTFPYFCDIDYLDEHAWANRWARPFSPDEIADLLRRRLGADGTEGTVGAPRVEVVAPGDVLEVRSWGDVEHLRAQSTFVEARPAPASEPASTDAFEPVDTTTLFGLDDPDERAELRDRLDRWYAGELLPWLGQLFADPDMPVHALVTMGVRWQAVVHAGGGERIVHHLDFGAVDPRLVPGAHPYPNYVVHVSGRALLTVLRGEGGSELFWLAGASRFYEKVLFVHDGRIAAPRVRGWDLFEAMPEPMSWCLRKHGPGAVAGPMPTSATNA